jgi:hypothetical protein
VTLVDIDATGLAENDFAMDVTSNEAGIKVLTAEERASLFQTTNGGTGVQIITTTGTGINATATGGGTPGLFAVNVAATNSELNIVDIIRRTTGTAANGIGGSIDFKVESDGGATETTASIASVLTDVTAGAEISKLIIRVRDGANGEERVAELTHEALSLGTGTVNVGLKAGDGGTTDYLEAETDGTLVFHGAATVWDDHRVPLFTARAPAANFPAWAQVTDDGAGSVGVFAYHFADNEYVWVTAQMPHSWKEGSTIYPHIHFETTSDVDPSDNFGVDIEYIWVDTDEDRAATTSSVSRDVPTGVNTATQHQLSDIPAIGIDGSGHTISSILLMRIERVAAAADNYADDIIIYDIDLHYEKDTVGSRAILTK